MRKRLALVMCTTTHQGAWSRVRGNELGVRVSRLAKGEYVRLELEFSASDTVIQYFREGAHPFESLSKGSRYRFCKELDEGIQPSPTTVEVLLHG